MLDLYIDEELIPFVGQVLNVTKSNTAVCIMDPAGCVLFDGVWKTDNDAKDITYNVLASDVGEIQIQEGKLFIKIKEENY